MSFHSYSTYSKLSFFVRFRKCKLCKFYDHIIIIIIMDRIMSIKRSLGLNLGSQ